MMAAMSMAEVMTMSAFASKSIPLSFSATWAGVRIALLVTNAELMPA